MVSWMEVTAAMPAKRVRLPDVNSKFTFTSIMEIREKVRRALLGAEEPVGADLTLKTTGRDYELSFDEHIGWPTVDGEEVSWVEMWKEESGLKV